MLRDKVLFDLIREEEERQRKGIELIASENYASDSVTEAVGSCLTNKYAEGLPGKRYYGGCEVVDKVENLAIDRLKELFGAAWANVQPHSGAQANAAVMLGFLKAGDPILGFDLAHGGHLTHGSPVSFSGQLYKAHFYGVKKSDGLIDYETLEEKALSVKPKMIIVGGSAYTRDWDYERVRKVADEVGAILLADISHPSGIIAKGYLNNPLEHCHVVTSTTHKTLRGPRGGIIMMGKDFPNEFGVLTKSGKRKRMSTILDNAVFPGTQGGPLEHVIAGKAVAFGEALTDSFDNYIQQVLKNAKQMAQSFMDRGYELVTNGTDNHCVLIDLHNKNITGKEAEHTLGQVDITINKNMVPFDDQPPFVTSGMRLGTPAITTRAMQESDIDAVVNYIDEALLAKDDPSKLAKIKKEVNEFCDGFPTFQLH